MVARLTCDKGRSEALNFLTTGGAGAGGGVGAGASAIDAVAMIAM